MIVSLSTIKNWFRRGLKPLQEQFWDVFDSYWHKQELIPTASVDGLDDVISSLPSEGDLAYLTLIAPLVVPVSGTATQALASDVLLETIILIGSGAWKVGTTVGGNEILESDVDGYEIFPAIGFYRTSAVTLHFTGTGTAKLYRQ